MEYPLVMKSPLFPFLPTSPPDPEENSPFRLSFMPSFCLFFRCSSSCITFAVSDAVAAFLMRLTGAGVDAPLVGCGVPDLEVSCGVDDAVAVALFVEGWDWPLVATSSATAACFFRFLLEPGAFFKACVRPCSLRLFALAARRSTSTGDVERMGMTLSVV